MSPPAPLQTDRSSGVELPHPLPINAATASAAEEARDAVSTDDTSEAAPPGKAKLQGGESLLRRSADAADAAPTVGAGFQAVTRTLVKLSLISTRVFPLPAHLGLPAESGSMGEHLPCR